MNTSRRIRLMGGKKLSLFPTKDGFVYSDAADTAYNWANNQLSYTDIPLSEMCGMFYFDLSKVIGRKIKSAKFKMYAENLTDAITLGMKLITTAWTEGVTTYNTKPTISATIYYQEVVASGVGWKTFDIKTLIQAIADGATYEGIWLYIVISSFWCQFCSAEGDNKPLLEITYM